MSTRFEEQIFSLPAGDVVFAAALARMDGQELMVTLTDKGVIKAAPIERQNRQLLSDTFQQDVAEYLDLEQSAELVAYQNFVAVYNVKGLTGVVIDLTDPDYLFPLHREDYHSKECSWPIAFVTLDSRVVLIHSTEWNRIDFTELPTGKLLTDRVVKWHEEKDNENYLDYFHSQIFVAPDQKHVVVNGWHWSPYDQIFAWNVEQFLKEWEPSGIGLSVIDPSGYNWDRPLCFVDNLTIAWAINMQEAGHDVAPEKSPTELIFQDIISKKIVKRMAFENFDLTAEMEAKGRLWFDCENRLFIASAAEKGTTITGESGDTILQRPSKTDFANMEAKSIGMIDHDTIRMLSW